MHYIKDTGAVDLWENFCSINITEGGKHLANNPSHTIEFSNVRVLGFERNTRKRRVLESLFIPDSTFNHKLLNDNLKSVPLYLFNLPYT